MRQIFLLTAALLFSAAATARADLLSMVNGDRYHGSIQLVNENEVHLKSEILGLVKIPRDKVSAIQFGNTVAPASLAAPAAATLKTNALVPGGQLVFDPKAIEQVRQEFLGTATPEASAIFSETLQGLSSGKISVEDIRAQARDTLKQLKDLQAELGEDGENSLLSTYGAILEKFVRAGGSQPTNAPASPRIKAPDLKLDEE